MEEKNKKNINRRDFIKIVGISAATSTAILYGCSSKGTSSSNSVSGEGEIPTDKMTYRTSPTTGDRVSLLGYGCMRWPLKPSPDGNGEVIDQDAVNGLVDYAIAHGVNYFDTSPAYVQGFSEKATGIALSRHHVTNILLPPNCPISRRTHGLVRLHLECIINHLQSFK